jgi:hypothetical protein
VQVGDVARLAAEEVARLQGQLADLDRKNRLQVNFVKCLTEDRQVLFCSGACSSSKDAIFCASE